MLGDALVCDSQPMHEACAESPLRLTFVRRTLEQAYQAAIDETHGVCLSKFDPGGTGLLAAKDLSENMLRNAMNSGLLPADADLEEGVGQVLQSLREKNFVDASDRLTYDKFVDWTRSTKPTERALEDEIRVLECDLAILRGTLSKEDGQWLVKETSHSKQQ